MITQAQLDDWLAALRSGEYEQGQRRLRREYPDGTTEYCCLGVLADRLKPSSWTAPDHTVGNACGWTDVNQVVYLPDGIIPDGYQYALSAMNDGRNGSRRSFTFMEIARYIEENPPPLREE
jgi:hypothetical protein